jgi:hypothetical protein
MVVNARSTATPLARRAAPSGQPARGRLLSCKTRTGHENCGTPGGLKVETGMSLSLLLLIVLLLLVIGALPSWPHSAAWGYAPSGILGAVMLAVLVLFLMGRL